MTMISEKYHTIVINYPGDWPFLRLSELDMVLGGAMGSISISSASRNVTWTSSPGVEAMNSFEDIEELTVVLGVLADWRSDQIHHLCGPRGTNVAWPQQCGCHAQCGHGHPWIRNYSGKFHGGNYGTTAAREILRRHRRPVCISAQVYTVILGLNVNHSLIAHNWYTRTSRAT